MIFAFVLLIFCASQVYWFWRFRRWILNRFESGATRAVIAAAAVLLFLAMIVFNAGWIGGRRTPIHLTPGEVLLGAPFALWIVSSLSAFLLVMLFWGVVHAVSGASRAVKKVAAPEREPDLRSPSRRAFLERGAALAGAAPFVAGAYGVLYGRLNLETPLERIALSRLPREFHGFRIAQLSDIHIGPFMTKEAIAKYAAIANSLKPHLIVLTGDYVTWDENTQRAVVEALAGLKAPFGVYGCLGNHDAWAGVQDSISGLFGKAGIRILRREAVTLNRGKESIRLIGVDFNSLRAMGNRSEGVTRRLLEGVDGLMQPGGVNILLSHNPDTFDRAAELGIDLTLSGHTHGGQASLEFISPQIAPSRIVTPYVAGLFEKPGGKLYVNRGIGTIGVPLRLGAPPEITLFELTRA